MHVQFLASMLPILLLSLLLTVVFHGHSVAHAADCQPASCGGLTVKYPFWLGGPNANQSSSSAPASCGHPAFEVWCNDDGVASLKGSQILVLRIDYGSSSFVAAHKRVAGGTDGVCKSDFNISSSIALSPFRISSSNRAICFLYNCNGTEPRGFFGLVNATSGCARPIFAFLGGSYDRDNPPAIPTGSCTYSYLPVLESAAPATLTAATNYSRLLEDGFVLEWEAGGVGDCSACKASNGQCRYDNAAVVFSCLCPDGGLRRSTCADGRHRVRLILIVSLSATTSLLLACIIWIAHRRKQNLGSFVLQWYTRDEPETEEILKRYQSLALKRFKYSELKKITRCFKDKLGEGGYGMVFKGSLQDGRMVAVKLLMKASDSNGEEFLNEVISIGSTSHVNIVSLLGFCLQGSKRALVYEYMANGSLGNYIYSDSSKMAISWEKFQEIAVGIARGLEYLHHGCNTRIIHFDIKPHNILLDEHFCPKIADFGLAKLCHVKDSVLSVAEARGTIGFIAPEVFSRRFGVVSTKSDVYSYGMMLLEMVGGSNNSFVKENTESYGEEYLPNWIYDHLVEELQRRELPFETEEIVRKMILVGLWCIQTTPAHRPSMSRVIEMLERGVDELEMPPKPFLSSSSLPHLNQD